MLLLDSHEQATGTPRGDVNLAHCRKCGFITNTSFDLSKVDYFGDYESSQAFSGTFMEFAKNSASELVERFHLVGKKVVEIGCGSGDFLDLLLEAGVESAVGIDPAPASAAIASKHGEKIRFINECYSPEHFSIPADLLVCRMTLEHISNVGDFVALLRQGAMKAGNCPIALTVPDAERVFSEIAFWDVYYEHCSYFSQRSLSNLFEECGLKVTACRLVYDDQYIAIEAVPTELPDQAAADSRSTASTKSDLNEMVNTFEAKREIMVSGWRRKFTEKAKQHKRSVIWGGGSKGVAFVNAMQLTDELDCLVDINPLKQGRYIAGTGHEIVGPESLRDRKPDWVLVMNPIYLEEIRQTLSELGIDAEVSAVES